MRVGGEGEGVDVFECCLGTEGGGVVDHGGDAFGLELGLEHLAVEGAVAGGDAELDGVLCPGGSVSFGDVRRGDMYLFAVKFGHAVNELGVVFGRLVDVGEFMVAEGFEFDAENGSLEGVEA